MVSEVWHHFLNCLKHFELLICDVTTLRAIKVAQNKIQ